MPRRSIPAPTPGSSHCVIVRGAREHNLRDVDVDIPRDALVVFSGISGSGKSSLAFGTLYAEAQRRYLESVAPYARRLIDQVGVPAVDSIDGLPPAVALQQQRGTPGTRSSVGSVTTLSNLLRMLYSRAGDYPARQPMLYAEDFSPNTPQGACLVCHGLGRVYEVTERAMVPDDSLSIRERAVAAWPSAWQGQNLRDILVTMGIDVDKPWRALPKKTRDWILLTEEQPTVPVCLVMGAQLCAAAGGGRGQRLRRRPGLGAIHMCPAQPERARPSAAEALARPRQGATAVRRGACGWAEIASAQFGVAAEGY
jgi:excinuclease ABC subunit A